MSTDTSPQQPVKVEAQGQEGPFDAAFLLTLGMVFSLTIGMFMVLFSLTYIHDLSIITEIPTDVWAFICGRPNTSNTTLPLLLTLSIVAFLLSGGLYGARWWILRGQSTEQTPSTEVDTS